jgi:DNA-binding protein YbaB
MIQDLTAAAVNAALTNAQRMVQEEFQRASIDIQLPGSVGPESAQ